MKNKNAKQVTDAGARGEYAVQQEEDFNWLAEMSEAISPYWAARLVTRSARARGLTSQGLQAKGR